MGVKGFNVGETIRQGLNGVDRKPVVAVDVDGVILDERDEVMPGARESLLKLKAEGWVIVIWTVRTDFDFIRQNLGEHGIPFDYINENPPMESGSRKLFFDVTVDDRAIGFKGDWAGAVEELTQRKKLLQEQGSLKIVLKSAISGMVAAFVVKHGRVEEILGSANPVVRELLEKGIQTDFGTLTAKDGELFLKSLLDEFTGSYLWAEKLMYV